MFTGYLTILVERITVSQPLVAGLRASNSGALAGYGQIPFTMKHCAHWNGPFEGRREDPEKRAARNRRDLHRHTAQVTTKVTFRLVPGLSLWVVFTNVVNRR
jgi:hypothetical protein